MNVDVAHDLPYNKYSFNKSNWAAGERRQDIISMCLIVMAYEMGAKNYEMMMKSQAEKKATINMFIKNPNYKMKVRNLIKEAIVRDNERVGISSILGVVDTMEVKKEYEDLLSQKKVKKMKI